MSQKWTEASYSYFLDGFAAEAELPRNGENSAEEQWAGLSRQLSGKERRLAEIRGAKGGEEMGRDFLRLYPLSERE